MDQFIVQINSHSLQPNRFWGSLMHGILMEALPAPIPERMHSDEVRPISQWVELETPSSFLWHINSIDDEVSEALSNLLVNGKTLQCKKLHCDWDITCVKHTHTSMQDYMKTIFLTPSAASGVSIQFKTTTTHKTNGRNACFPTV